MIWDFAIVLSVLIITTMSSMIIAFGNINEIAREHFKHIATRIVFLCYGILSGIATIKFLEMYFNKPLL